jgi:tRNA(Ile2) C34 agmatinyltransferase TiaS
MVNGVCPNCGKEYEREGDHDDWACECGWVEGGQASGTPVPDKAQPGRNGSDYERIEYDCNNFSHSHTN